eukprot:339631-Ditylum_brightwellii.AAC.1
MQHIFNDEGAKKSIDYLLKGDMATTWLSSTVNELGQSSNGIPGRVEESKTIGFIKQKDVP